MRVHRPLFGVIVPLSGFVSIREQLMHVHIEFVRDDAGHASVGSSAQDIAYRIGRKAAVPFESENTAITLLQLGFDVDRMERHG
ncbi:MAG: hypothetical protein RLN87_04540 [Parasphingopyxis sp.]|nr:hypothetical protein [uncultured Parasphingopyxis sp.]